jgi:hypothetical protein
MKDKIIGMQCQPSIEKFRIKALEYEGKTKPFKNKDGKWIIPTKPVVPIWGYT